MSSGQADLITSDFAPGPDDSPVAGRSPLDHGSELRTDNCTPSPTIVKPPSTKRHETLVDNIASSAPRPATVSFRFLSPGLEPDEIGRLGSYRVLRLLGQGGMAFVFLAEDNYLKRSVALKVMKPDLDNDPTAGQRFLREARALASINHDHVVKVFQVGQEERTIFLAMELLQGETLDDWIVRNGPPRPDEIIRLAREIASGLAVIHGKGLIHRDLKPNNIWVETPHQRIKLLDFGLARPVDDDLKFTGSGYIVGTPAFMSPEQARGNRIDERSDLFSLGSVLYFVASGRLPFQAGTAMGVLTALAVDAPRPIAELNPQLPKALAELIMQLLAKSVDDRPASARTVIELLDRIEKNRSTAVMPELAAEDKTQKVAALPQPSERSENSATISRRTSVLAWVGCGLAFGLIIFFVKGPLLGSKPGNDERAPSESAPRAEISHEPDANGKSADRPKNLETSKVANVPPSEVAGIANSSKPSLSQTPPPVLRPELKKENSPRPEPKSIPTYLSSMKPYLSANWVKEPPAPPRDHFGARPPKDFPGVQINGKLSPHGIFMHAPMDAGRGPAYVIYRLEKQYSVFRSEVSLNDGPEEAASPMQFAVYGDGKVLWTSRGVKTQADTQKCDISVKGVDLLMLEVTCSSDMRGTHGAWVEPHVIR